MYMYVLFELVYYMYMYLCYWYILYMCMLHRVYYCYFIQYKQTPVYAAAYNGHVGALNVLIRAKADVNAADGVSLVFILHKIFFCYKNKP